MSALEKKKLDHALDFIPYLMDKLQERTSVAVSQLHRPSDRGVNVAWAAITNLPENIASFCIPERKLTTYIRRLPFL